MEYILSLPGNSFLLLAVFVSAFLGFVAGWVVCYRFTLYKLYKHVKTIEIATKKFRKAVFAYRKL